MTTDIECRNELPAARAGLSATRREIAEKAAERDANLREIASLEKQIDAAEAAIIEQRRATIVGDVKVTDDTPTADMLADLRLSLAARRSADEVFSQELLRLHDSEAMRWRAARKAVRNHLSSKRPAALAKLKAAGEAFRIAAVDLMAIDNVCFTDFDDPDRPAVAEYRPYIANFGPVAEALDRVSEVQWFAWPYDCTDHWIAQIGRVQQTPGLEQEISRLQDLYGAKDMRELRFTRAPVHAEEPIFIAGSPIAPAPVHADPTPGFGEGISQTGLKELRASVDLAQGGRI